MLFYYFDGKRVFINVELVYMIIFIILFYRLFVWNVKKVCYCDNVYEWMEKEIKRIINGFIEENKSVRINDYWYWN